MVKKKNIIKNIILVITVLVLMALIVYFVGRSYGFFQYVKKGETTNVITIKGIRVDIIEDDNALNLENAEPLYDSDGMQLKAFTFSITNTSKRPLSYTMKVVNDTDKQSACLINEGTAQEGPCPVLTTDNIRYSYKLNSNSWNEAANLGANNDVITTYTINGNETLTYSIRMWIKSDATNDIMNHYFFGQLLIQGTQAAQEMYRPYDVATILSNFNQEDLKEVVACSNDNKYQDCEIYNTIEEAIAAKDKSVIILTEDLEKTITITVPADKDIVLEMNGNDMNRTGNTGAIFSLYGTMDVRNSASEKSTMTSLGTVFRTYEDSKLITSNIDIISTNIENASTICTQGEVIVNSGTYIEGPYGIGCHNADGATTTINGGTVNATVVNALQTNTGNEGYITVNDAVVEAKQMAIRNNGTGTITINGGTYTAETQSAILNSASGTINIVQTDKPIYITSLAQAWRAAVQNSSTGTINITANQANACTTNASDTTSGLCVYAEGDKNYSQNTANIAIQNSTSTTSGGTINIDGGTYFGGYTTVYNSNQDTNNKVNIKNANLISGRLPLVTYSGKMQICNSNISNLNSNNNDIYFGTDGIIFNYSSDVVFMDGTNVPKTTGAGVAIVTASATCPITD